jgi:hypothetical protein
MKKFIAHVVLTFVLLLGLSNNLIAQYAIQGNVYYHDDLSKPMSNTTVFLKTTSGTLVATAPTDAMGYYSFLNIAAGTYKLTAVPSLLAGGVNLEDSYLILLHLFGLYNLTPIQFLAADVNGSGTVTWSDYFTIVFGWFVYGYPFPAGDWQCISTTVVAGLKEGSKINVTSTGDINGTWSPNITKGTEPLNMISYQSQVKAKAGQLVQIPIYAETATNLNGFAFSLAYPTQFATIKDVISDYGKVEFQANYGELRLVWSDETAKGITPNPNKPLFSVVAQLNDEFNENDEFILTILNENQMLGQNGKLITDYKLKSNAVIWSNMNENALSILPNPVNDQSVISLSLNTASNVQFDIINAAGQVVTSVINSQLSAGIHTISLEDLPKNGLYFYRCTINNSQQDVLTGKILVKK